MINSIVKKIFNLFFSKEFMIFLVVGATASIVNFTSGFLFRMVFPDKYFFTVSIWVGYLCGSVVSFILNKMVTFKAHDEKIVNQMTKFFLVFVLSVVIASGIGNVIMIIYHSLKIEIFTVKQAETLARLMSIGLTTLFNYPAIKFFSFRRIRIGSK